MAQYGHAHFGPWESRGPKYENVTYALYEHDGTQSLGKMMQEIDCNDLFWPKTLPRPDMAMPIFD